MPITRTDLAMECFENADGGAIPGTQVSHWESDGIEITGGNFGFDPAAGITEVELDPQQEHYYLEIREIR